MSRKLFLLPLLFAFAWLVLGSTNANADGGSSAPLKISYQGDYYDNQWLSREPLFSRTDADINFNWGGESPDGRLENDFFSVRWTSSFYLAESTTMRFYARADDGIRILVNGQVMLNAYTGEAKPGFTTERRLPAGTHEVVVEYYEYNGTAYAQVQMTGVDGTPLPAKPNTPPPPGGNGDCVIPESGPWPPCATGGGTPPAPPANPGECVIPPSGPWPACAR